MKVHLSWPSGPPLRRERDEFAQLIALDRLERYVRVARHEDADLTLVCEPRGENEGRLFHAINSHPLIRAGDDRTFVYVEDDEPYCIHQGLYCSMPRRWANPFRQRAVAYRTIWNPFVNEYAERRAWRETKWLFSFTGQANVPVRKALLGLQGTRAKVTDSTPLRIYNSPPKQQLEAAQRAYADEILESKFVLCPRGKGTSSFRLFETMALGRVPVILSDQWVAPRGPDWASFSLRVRERDAGRVPEIIEAAEPRWEQMAAAARAAWEEWFAPDILFHRMVEACLDIRKNNILPERVWRKLPDAQQVCYRAKGVAGRVKRAVGWPGRHRRPGFER